MSDIAVLSILSFINNLFDPVIRKTFQRVVEGFLLRCRKSEKKKKVIMNI